MLVEFRVRNFLSLRDEQVLSFVASSDKDRIETNTIPSGDGVVPRLLVSAVVYGANASGKTNLLEALWNMRQFVEGSAVVSPTAQIMKRCFRLDPGLRTGAYGL